METKKELFIRGLNVYKQYNQWEQKLHELGIEFWERIEIQELLMQYIEMLNLLAEQFRLNDESSTDVENYIFESTYMNDCKTTFISDDMKAIGNLTPEQFWNYLEKKNPNLAK